MLDIFIFFIMYAMMGSSNPFILGGLNTPQQQKAKDNKEATMKAGPTVAPN
jgi:hypothetical protein